MMGNGIADYSHIRKVLQGRKCNVNVADKFKKIEGRSGGSALRFGSGKCFGFS